MGLEIEAKELRRRAVAGVRDEVAGEPAIRWHGAFTGGAPIYERLGFADSRFIEMWEMRR